MPRARAVYDADSASVATAVASSRGGALDPILSKGAACRRNETQRVGGIPAADHHIPGARLQT